MFGFMILSLGLMLLPGPDMALVSRYTFLSGRRAGFLVVAGILTGFSFYAALSALGLAALLIGSELSLVLLKLFGGGYLLYLAVNIFRSYPEGKQVKEDAGAYRSGLLSNLLNPKQTLFLVLVPPQFLPASPSGTDVAMLFAVFACVSMGFWVVFVLLLDKLNSYIAEKSIWIERIIGGSLLGFGIWMIAGAVVRLLP